MKLRHKLVFLHSSLALFAVITSAATIYGVGLHVNSAIAGFNSLIDHSHRAAKLRIEARAQLVYLQELVTQRRDITKSYEARRDAFFTQLAEVAAFPPVNRKTRAWKALAEAGEQWRLASNHFLAMIRASEFETAREILQHRIDRDLHTAVDARLAEIHTALDRQRKSALNNVARTNVTMLAVVGLICLACLAFLVASSWLVRRWLIGPILGLQTGAAMFASGKLEHRMAASPDDEIGNLGSTLNQMASSLQTSQTKYRSLFENLQDAMIICDRLGTIEECHDGDTKLLCVQSPDVVGQRFTEVWPQWAAVVDWMDMAARVAEKGAYIRAMDVVLAHTDGRTRVVDLSAYPIAFDGARFAAFVLRDVTERHRLQKLEQRAETMEAAETFARGIAHDFKNLLNNLATTLSNIHARPTDEKNKERAESAIAACRQAAAMSNRLLTFSCSNEGTPEVIVIHEVLGIVLESMEPSNLQGMTITTDLDDSLVVFMDRDHLTRVALNLINNAREAMPKGGSLHISSYAVEEVNPWTAGPASSHCVLLFRDSGCGISEDIRERIFEPLFSTKPRSPGGVRGLGLAFTYAAVRHAGGFVLVESEPGLGTTMEVHLPVSRIPSQQRIGPTPRKNQSSNEIKFNR